LLEEKTIESVKSESPRWRGLFAFMRFSQKTKAPAGSSGRGCDLAII
jgi:hypothetical protein